MANFVYIALNYKNVRCRSGHDVEQSLISEKEPFSYLYHIVFDVKSQIENEQFNLAEKMHKIKTVKRVSRFVRILNNNKTERGADAFLLIITTYCYY